MLIKPSPSVDTGRLCVPSWRVFSIGVCVVRVRARRSPRRGLCLPNSTEGTYTDGEVVTTVSQSSELLTGARQVLERNWREGRTPGGLDFGYTCPDAEKYPDQFFWDSCF